ncbi:transposase [Nostoc sp. PCC 7107]|uniref:transposase n=1 Tax=Nostoc sp. PCC 7107 TaxID=317936 RepID=UPI0026462E61|nr:transposase [Nostoc sp. PCC 7107]
MEAAGCQILYLPPYSADRNRIEKIWATLKGLVRKLLPTSDHLRDAIETVLKQVAS